MSIAAAVLTHNVIAYDRLGLLQDTLYSLAAQEPDALFVISNGSDDGTEEYVDSIGGTVVDDPISTCGHGMNVSIGIAVESGCDVVVFSNDDIAFEPDALYRIERFWEQAPDDLLIASGLLEDDYPWNTVYERIEVGSEVGLVRRTAPGGVWTLRASDWPRIQPVPEAAGWDDVPVSLRLQANGYRVAQFEWAHHRGQDRSTWENASHRFGKPLDRKKWGVPLTRPSP